MGPATDDFACKVDVQDRKSHLDGVVRLHRMRIRVGCDKQHLVQISVEVVEIPDLQHALPTASAHMCWKAAAPSVRCLCSVQVHAIFQHDASL